MFLGEFGTAATRRRPSSFPREARRGKKEEKKKLKQGRERRANRRKKVALTCERWYVALAHAGMFAAANRRLASLVRTLWFLAVKEK